MITDILHMLKIPQGNALTKGIERIYFSPEQMGSQELMTPGLVDVRRNGTLYFHFAFP